MSDLEERVAKIEGTVSQMNERLNHLGDEITDIRSEIRANFKWTLAILPGSWITIIGTFVGFFVILLNNRLQGRKVHVLVDSGATYTTVPEEMLEAPGVEKTEKVRLEIADGRVIERYLGNALIEVEGRLRANPVVFGKDGDIKILGLITLESCGLMIDPTRRKLVSLPSIHHYLKRNYEK